MLSPSIIKFFARLNILCQVTFPLAGVFTPLVASAQNEIRFLNSPSSGLQTQIYTLTSGETVNSVAARFNMTSSDLRKLNQFRTFANGFDNLKSGDELEVPLKPLPKVVWDKTLDDITDKQDKQAQKVAGMATKIGGFLSSHPGGGAATATAKGMATGEASGQLQKFLGRFGTARAQLNADDNFSLKNSQLDLLIPLYEQQDRLIFTQGSVHRADERTQANLGVGVRRFYDEWMMGANTFLDYDLSRDHARSGVGLEYGRNYLKLTGNGYTPLTGWKESPDVKGYDERPARGWDLRAQAWIPELPQLGGKLTYEQYYGKQVALFGKNNRQHNPRAVTAGVTYTPVPLITFSAEKRQGQSGKNDAQFGFGLTWQPGVPLSQQLDPAGVGALRTLIGGRYDLVERNNNIVLEYRKRDDLKLRTIDLVSGYAGEEKSLGVSVTSRYTLKKIEWSAVELEAAGGKVTQGAGNSYNVVLPVWQSSAKSSNSYVVSGVAIDSRGNRSNRSNTQVTVQAPQINGQRSSFTPGESTLPADGKSTQVLTLTIRDNQNMPVDIEASEIDLNIVKHTGAKVSAPIRKSAGVLEITVTAGTMNDTIKITPTIMGVTLPSATVAVTSIIPDGLKSVFSASSSSIQADNTVTTTLTFTASDTQGNKITGIADNIAFVVQDETGAVITAGVTVSNITESSPGIYTAQMKGTRAGTYTVQPHVNGNPLGQLTTVVTLTTGTVDNSQSSFTISNSRISADNNETTTLTLTAKDFHGNQLIGINKDLAFVAKDSVGSTVTSGIFISVINENSPGVYTATLKGTLAGSFTIVPELNGNVIGSLKADVALTPGTPDGTKSTLNASELSIQADNTTTSTLTLTVMDMNGNRLSGLAGGLNFMVKDHNGTPITSEVIVSDVTEINSGVYTATLKGSKAGSYTVVPQLNSNALGNLSIVVTLTVGNVDSSHSTFTANQQLITADNIEHITLTFTAKDLHNNAITGLSSSLEFVVTDSNNNVVNTGVTISNISEIGNTGVYTANMAGTLAGTYTVVPHNNGSAVGNMGIGITLTSGVVNGNQSSFTASASTITADDVRTTELTFTARDLHNNIITGLAGNLTFLIKDSSGSSVTTGVTISAISETGTTGVYTATMKGTLPGNYIVTPQISGTTVESQSVSVTLTKIPELHLTTQVVTNNVIADGISEDVIRVLLKDENGANVDTSVTVSLTAGNSQSVVYPSSIQLSNGTADIAIKSNKAGDYTFNFSATTSDTYSQATQSVTFRVDDTKTRLTLTTDSGLVSAAYKENRNLTVTMTDEDGNSYDETKNVSLSVTSDNGAVSLVKLNGNDVSNGATLQIPAGQTTQTFTFSSAIAGNYTISASYTTSKGSAVTATVDEEATIEITGWKYKTTGGSGKTVNSNFRPSFIAQGDTAQVLLNDTADYNSYYSFSLTGGNAVFSIDSDIVTLASVITNANQVSTGDSLVVSSQNGTSQLTTSPVYALMASSGVISTGSGNSWRAWGSNITYCQSEGNDAVSMEQFQTYQNETGALRTNNTNSVWTSTAIENTQQAYYLASNGAFTAAGIFENKVSVCILPI